MGSNSGATGSGLFLHVWCQRSSDNDQSVLAFADNPGDSNWWGDSWRYDAQNGAMWSFLERGDYHWSTTYHIGNGYAQGYAGYKTYELDQHRVLPSVCPISLVKIVSHHHPRQLAGFCFSLYFGFNATHCVQNPI